MSKRRTVKVKQTPVKDLQKQEAANKFDKILKENAPDSIDRIIEIATNLRFTSAEDFPHEVQYTLERRPDFLKKVIESDGTNALWHVEYQVPDDKNMVFRFLVYCGLFKRALGNTRVRQFVIYLGETPPTMQTEIIEPDLHFRFQLIALINIPYEKFLESGKPEEAILAMLGNLKETSPESVIQTVIQTIVKNSDSELEKQRYLQQIQVMGQLRHFEQKIENIMESESLQDYVSIERTYFYKKGAEATSEKYEKLLATSEKLRREEESRRQEAETKRQEEITLRKKDEIRLKEEEAKRKEEEAKRKEEEAKRKEEEQNRQYIETFAASLLLSATASAEQIAPLRQTQPAIFEQIEAKITSVKTLLQQGDIDWEMIAQEVGVSVDFVKVVAEA